MCIVYMCGVYISEHMGAHVCIDVWEHMFFMCAHVSTCARAWVHPCEHVCVITCAFVCMHFHVCMCVTIYTLIP